MRGQSLAEFALAIPVLMLILGGIIQFGIIFWGQNTLTQIARDTGRWAATQEVPCWTAATVTTEANLLASTSSLIGYRTAADLTVTAALTGPDPCPVINNTQVAYVTVTLSHRVPVFFPFIPGNGNLSTSAQFRMEPHP